MCKLCKYVIIKNGVLYVLETYKTPFLIITYLHSLHIKNILLVITPRGYLYF